MIFIIILIIMVIVLLKNPELAQPAPQTGQITGTLTYNATPVANATVELLDTTDKVVAATISDATGKYTLPYMAAGTYTVAAAFVNTDGTWLEGEQQVILNAALVTVDLALVNSYSNK